MCSTFSCTLNSWTSKTCSAPLKDPVFSKVFKTLFNSSEEPNLSRCSRQVLAGPTAHDGWLPVKVTCRLSKLKESKVESSYRDHCQLFVPASSSLDKLPEKRQTSSHCKFELTSLKLPIVTSTLTRGPSGLQHRGAQAAASWAHQGGSRPTLYHLLAPGSCDLLNMVCFFSLANY